MSVNEILRHINDEDKTVPAAIEKVIPRIEALVHEIIARMRKGGRLFYFGAGTSGRLGIVDASECPPTFGVPAGWVTAIIAGGEGAIRNAVEFAEDDREQAWKDLQACGISSKDVVVGITASGTTPYVLGGLESCKVHGVFTGCISCNENSPSTACADIGIECVTGPEFVTGSTRMKAGTAQKLILNMISTSVMIGLGRVKGNKMIDMQLSNNKLVGRGIKILMDELKINMNEAEQLLAAHGSVRRAIEWYSNNA